MRTSVFGRFLAVAWLLFIAAAAGAPARAGGVELVMVERAGCAYCARWNSEVAPVYDKTPEAQRAPLRRVNLDDGQPKGIVQPVRYTPTFLLMKDGGEVGRITGYFDDGQFWGLLGDLMRRLDAAAADAKRG